jgi:hypothetical protein
VDRRKAARYDGVIGLDPIGRLTLLLLWSRAMRVSEEVLFEEGKIRVTTRRFVVGNKTYAIASITAVEHQRSVGLKLKSIAAGLVLVALSIAVGYFASWHVWSWIAIGVSALWVVLACFLPIKHSAVITTPSGELRPLSSWGYRGGLVERVVEGLNDAIIAGD